MVRGQCSESQSSVPGRLKEFVKRMRILESVEIFKFLVYFGRVQVGYAAYGQLWRDFVEVEELVNRELDD